MSAEDLWLTDGSDILFASQLTAEQRRIVTYIYSGSNGLGLGNDTIIIDIAGYNASSISTGNGADYIDMGAFKPVSDSDNAYGGNGQDTIFGSLGDDDLFGNFGSDRINGRAGEDSIDAGPGDDTLTGGRGSDNFSFNYAQLSDVPSAPNGFIVSGDLGTDTIRDFHAKGPEADIISMNAGLTFAELQIRQSGADVIIHAERAGLPVHAGPLETTVDFWMTLILRDVQLADITAANFDL